MYLESDTNLKETVSLILVQKLDKQKNSQNISYSNIAAGTF